MNTLEKQRLEIGEYLVKECDAEAYKASFEDEGASFEDISRAKIITEKVGLNLDIKIGGCEAIANIREAKYAHSKADFVAKLQISLKECYETEYWIEIAQKANIISEDIAKSVLHDCGSIRRMLIASINTAKGDKQ